MDFYKEIGYASLGVGTRDLYGSWEFLSGETSKRGLEILSANLDYKGSPACKPYKLFKTERFTVAVIALTSPYLNSRLRSEGLSCRSPAEALESILPQIMQKSRVIILLSNLGVNEDKKLADKFQDIDLIIGSGSGAQTYEPLKVANTYILRSHSKGKSVGRVKLTIDGNGRIIDIDNELVMLTAKVKKDADAQKRIDEFKKKFPGKQVPVVTFTKSKQHKNAANPFLEALKKARQNKKNQQLESDKSGEGKPNDGVARPVANPFLELLQRKRALKTKNGSEEVHSNPKSESEEPKSEPRTAE